MLYERYEETVDSFEDHIARFVAEAGLAEFLSRAQGGIMGDIAPDRAIFRSAEGWLVFEEIVGEVIAREPADVPAVLETVESAVNGKGLYAAGFLSYEAASAYGLAVHHPIDGLPPAVFALYRRCTPVDHLPAYGADTGRIRPDAWRPLLPRGEYTRAITAVKHYLEAGHSYQVNYTFPLEATLIGRAGIAAARAVARTPARSQPLAPAAEVSGDELFAWFGELLSNEPPPYAAFLDFAQFSILSLSPELFFSLEGRTIIAKPMKGTAPRGHNAGAPHGGGPSVPPGALSTAATEDDSLGGADPGGATGSVDDREPAKRLFASEKDRAENLMIVDMIRNDLGRIADIGSVSVDRLFDIETYPTVYQMTSTVRALTSARLARIFEAMFPCASVTGAPKVRTMEIIRELEPQPRGVYCGAIGYLMPDRRGQFNVAIRTALVDKVAGSCRYGVGSGIVWDSETESEYEECLIKAAAIRGSTTVGHAKANRGAGQARDVAAVVHGESSHPEAPAQASQFLPDGIIESLLFHRSIGYFLLERHINRLIDTADALGFAWGGDAPPDTMTENLRAILADMANDLLEAAETTVDVPAPPTSRQTGEASAERAWKVRLVLSRDGEIGCAGEPLDRDPLEQIGAALDRGAVQVPFVRAVLAPEPIDADEPALYFKTTSRDVYEQAGRSAGVNAEQEVILWNNNGLVTEGSRSNIVVERRTRGGGNRRSTLVTPPVECGLLAGTFRGHLLDCGIIDEKPVTVEELLGAEAVYLINSVRLWRRANVVAE